MKLRFPLLLLPALCLLAGCSEEEHIVPVETFVPPEVFHGTALDDSIVRQGLPTVIVTTIDGTEPTCDIAQAPEGLMGTGITNLTSVPGKVIVVENGLIVFNSGDYLEGVGGMTYRIRGNSSSAYPPKKSYKIRLERKADMLTRGNSRFSDRNWVLLSNLTTFTNFVGNKVAGRLGQDWTPAIKYVNLIVNNDYRGMYVLGENVRRNADARINVNRRNGYIIEADAYFWNGRRYFKTSLADDDFLEKTGYTFKYPDQDNLTDGQMAYISEATHSMEASLTTADYPKYIDVESFANWLIGHDFLGDTDSFGSNIYITKKDNSSKSKFKMGPIWDYDAIMLVQNHWAPIHAAFYYRYLFKSPDRTFARAYVSRWREVGASLTEGIISDLHDLENSEEGRAIDRSAKLDAERWGGSYKPLKEHVSKAETYLRQRKEWLDGAMKTIQL